MDTKAGNKVLRGLRLRSLLPVILGVSLGFALSIFYIPVVEQLCLVDLQQSRPEINLGREEALREINEPRLRGGLTGNPESDTPTPVTPKRSQFNYDFRPYFVYSELGFRFKLVVGVLTTEARLESFAIAINNTWLSELPKVLFFTPYSKDVNFHEKFNRKLNLNVVQLPDIDEDSSQVDFSFKMLQYMRDHYLDNYNWFMRVNDNVYINAGKLLAFLTSVNSSEELYLGHPRRYEGKQHYEGSGNGAKALPNSASYYCFGGTGIVLSRSVLMKIVNHLETCGSVTVSHEDDVEIGRCVRRYLGISCVWNEETLDKFHVSQQKKAITTKDLEKDPRLQDAYALYPIQSAYQMLQIHKFFVTKKLKHTFSEIQRYQSEIQKMIPSLPEGVPEKKLYWPIGFPPPFKPTSRFEVIPWSYFTTTEIYGNSDIQPAFALDEGDKRDVQEVLKVGKERLQHEYPNSKMGKISLINGYRRLDPQRGSEYVLDMEVMQEASKPIVRRLHFLRPFTKVEALQMPAATEQRGIHLVLPVLKDDIGRFEQFLQMYKRVCLQTGENVVLLSVFINIRGKEAEVDQRDDVFLEAKNLISRFKHSYMWAQLPWLQVGVRQPSPTLIMDIVSMKLPSNALIFLVTLTIDFTINFLNRCRVNVVNGMQVFFPVPFAEYNPEIVYKDKQKPAFVDVHRDTGMWDRKASDVACFSNKDYKDLRMQREDFLDENQSIDTTLISVFQNSKLHVFRAVDAELRRKYAPLHCPKTLNGTRRKRCREESGEHMGSRSQLAQYLFQKEKKT